MESENCFLDRLMLPGSRGWPVSPCLRGASGATRWWRSIFLYRPPRAPSVSVATPTHAIAGEPAHVRLKASNLAEKERRTHGYSHSHRTEGIHRTNRMPSSFPALGRLDVQFWLPAMGWRAADHGGDG